MGTNEDDVVLVTPLALGDNVVGGPELEGNIDKKRRLQLLSSSKTVGKHLPIRQGDGDHRWMLAVRFQSHENGRAVGVVPYDRAQSTGLLRQQSLEREVTLASLDKRDCAGSAFVVSGNATKVRNGEEGASGALRASRA